MDLNRNFPTEFNYYHATPGDPIYGGSKPINQPFTICLESVLEEKKPDIFLDFHSGANGDLFHQNGVNQKQELKIVNGINDKFCGGKCRITTLRKDGEAINGHIFADVKVRLKVPISILFEVYGD